MIDVNIPRKVKACLSLDLLKAFGADFQLNIRDPIFFAGEDGKAIIYPVGHHIAIRDIFIKEELRKNDIMFIYNDNDVEKVSSMNVSKDYSLLLVCEKKAKLASISVYNLSKLNFKQISIFKPKRKVISEIYSEFTYASFSQDGNFIASLGILKGAQQKDEDSLDSNKNIIHGIIWDVQIFQPYNKDNYKPKCIIALPNTVTKITIENKLICTSGKNHLSFWYIYESNAKEFKGQIKGLDISMHNFVDHDWLHLKVPTIAAITDKSEIYFLEGYSESANKNLAKKSGNNSSDDEDDSAINYRVKGFKLKDSIVNCYDNASIIACIVKSFHGGLIVGSTQGHIVFLEKTNENKYFIRTYSKREKEARVVGVTFSKGDEYMAVAYESNEIASINIKNIFESSLKDKNLKLKMNLVCGGFHQGPITAMDVAIQRPIIVTTSNVDKTVRVWNFLTGHCEYCKIILTEKEKNQEKEMDILSVAIHPNGYYIAISDKDMIRFFHLCYKELRFYNTDNNSGEPAKSNCHLLKFSYGGHLLAAVSGKHLYIIKSYTRETLKTFETPHNGEITNIFFHSQDYYVYTVGTDGLIVEYNLFNFHVEKLSTKYINYTGGSFSNLTKTQNCVASVGKQTSDYYSITEVICTEIESQDTADINRTNDVYITPIDKLMCSICSIKSKRYDIKGYAAGSDDGYLGLYPQLVCQGRPTDTIYPWKSLKSHRGKITNIAYNRDTNLLFSAGDDGNLFIYCVHELSDGETLPYDDVNSMNQINTILDEGLGDNVLYPLSAIFLQEEEIQNQNNLIEEYKNQEEKIKDEHKNKIREIEQNLNKKFEGERKQLNELNQEQKLAKESTKNYYEEQIKKREDAHRQTLIDKEKQYTERLDQMSSTIHDLTSQIHSLISQHEKDLKDKDESYEKKFKEIDSELRKKFEEIKSVNDKLTNDLELQRKTEEYKFIHFDQEHEQEINYNNQKFETIIAQMEKDKIKNQGEIARLEDEKKKFIIELNKYEAELKKKKDELQQQYDAVEQLKIANEQKEKDKEDYKKKIQVYEVALQEKTKLAGFCSKLKNELYLKNVEIQSKFNKEQLEKEEIRFLNKEMEKNMNEGTKKLEENVKELNKKAILVDEYKRKYEEERHNLKIKEKDFDNLLQKIYDSFQTNDKNEIIKGIRQIYNMYLTSEEKQKINSSKLNVNIRDELTKQIDFLQKGIMNITDNKSRREKNQNSEIAKKSKENAVLIKHLNQKKTDYYALEKKFVKLNSDFSALKKKYEIACRTMNNSSRVNTNMQVPMGEPNQMSQTMYNFRADSSNLPNVKSNDPFSNTIYKVKDDSGFNEKKSWKDTKLYKGNCLSVHKNRGDAFKITEIKNILEEKNEIIRKQSIEIQMLQNKIASNKKEMGYTTYQGFKLTNYAEKEEEDEK